MSDKSYKAPLDHSLETPPRGIQPDMELSINTQSQTGEENHETSPKSLKERNKGGRPKGSKSKTTLLSEAIANDFTRLARSNSRKVFKTLADKAIEGEPWAVKLFMDKIVPNAQPIVETRGAFGGIQIIINDMKPEIKEIEGEIVEED